MADVVLAAVIVLFALRGGKRGFARSLVGIASTVLSLVFSMLLYGPVSTLIYNSEIGGSIREWAQELILEKIKDIPLVEMAVEKAAEAVSMLIIAVITFVVVIVVVKIAIMLIAKTMNIAAKLPLVKQANSLLGLVTGAVSGVLICYIIIGAIGAIGLGEIADGEGIVKSIENSYIAVNLYNNNIITDMLLKFIK